MTDKQKAGNESPIFWYRPRTDGGYEGPLHNGQIEDVRKASGAWVPLFAGSAPVSAEQELIDVKAGIPARDAEIDALRKEIETLKAQLKIPTVVHSNMCRGIIAPITFDMLAHVLGDEEKQEWLASQAQQPVSSADGQSLAQKVRRDLYRRGCSEAVMRIAVESIVKHYDPPQSPGNPGQPDHFADTRKMVTSDQLHDAAQMIEPSGSIGDLDDPVETLRMMRGEYDPKNGPMSTLKAKALDTAIAALARQGSKT